MDKTVFLSYEQMFDRMAQTQPEIAQENEDLFWKRIDRIDALFENTDLQIQPQGPRGVEVLSLKPEKFATVKFFRKTWIGPVLVINVDGVDFKTLTNFVTITFTPNEPPTIGILLAEERQLLEITDCCDVYVNDGLMAVYANGEDVMYEVGSEDVTDRTSRLSVTIRKGRNPMFSPNFIEGASCIDTPSSAGTEPTA